MNIILAVTGSISAYKSYDILRGLIKQGNIVKVVLSKGALNFVKKDLYLFLGAAEVLTTSDDFSAKSSSQIKHIELARFCERLIIAPASANCISNLYSGGAEGLLYSLFLALDQSIPIIIYPAMNTKMFSHPFTKRNLKELENLPQVFIHPTQDGELACGEIGEGKLPDVEHIIEMCTFINPKRTGKKVLITTGATNNPIDSVRYVTNPSSGLTGYHLAKYAYSLGHDVVLLAGQNSTTKIDSLKNLNGVKVETIGSSSNMHQMVLKYFPESDYYISAAAIGDLEFPTQKEKLKKASMGNSLDFIKAQDILKDVLRLKKKNQILVGFAAESSLNYETLNTKWNDKPVDLLIGTQVNNGLFNETNITGFKQDSANYNFFSKGEIKFTGQLSKPDLAKQIFEWNYD